jgi:hypothetical protein
MHKKYFVLGFALAAILRAAPELAVSGVYTDPMGYKKYVTVSSLAVHIAHVVGGGAPMYTHEIVRRAGTDKYGGLVVYTDKSIYKIYERGDSAYVLYINDADGTPRAAMIIKKEAQL